MFQNLQDVFAARLAILVENEKLEAGEANIAVIAIRTLVENTDTDELLNALKDALWMDETAAEVGPPPAKIREGVDNDGLTEDEANAALDEQHTCTNECPPATWPQDEFGREIDPALNPNPNPNDPAYSLKARHTRP